jgi:hypothetical protein
MHSAGLREPRHGNAQIVGVRRTPRVRGIPGVVTGRCGDLSHQGGERTAPPTLPGSSPGGPRTSPSRVSPAPQNPHKSGSAESFPTESPRTQRHSPGLGSARAGVPSGSCPAACPAQPPADGTNRRRLLPGAQNSPNYVSAEGRQFDPVPDHAHGASSVSLPACGNATLSEPGAPSARCPQRLSSFRADAGRATYAWLGGGNLR